MSVTLTGPAPSPHADSAGLRTAFAVATGVSLLPFALALAGHPVGSGWAAFAIAFVPFTIFSMLYIWATYRDTHPGIKNDDITRGHFTGRRTAGVLLGVVLTGLYTVLYFQGEWLQPVFALTDPLSQLLRDRPADQWFLYGFLYTLAVLIMGARMFWRYRHNRYQMWRTASVMFFQLGFAFLLPAFLLAMQQPEFYFTYFWPLKPDYLYPSYWAWLWQQPGGVGAFMLMFGVAASFVLTPILTFYFGKRWYCSWVCGCGGLAETAGDPFRHLSSKKYAAWRFERWSIHSVLVIITALTIWLWVGEGEAVQTGKKWYGYAVGMVLSGIVGVGFYPLLGSRVWCRFFCPMAAILGIFQRFFSRFRITTNGDQCMACGNCSAYCEMGIDVRAYAMQGKNIVRASCVGCGICSAVCPRGVLKLENGKTHADRYDGAQNPLATLLRSLKNP